MSERQHRAAAFRKLRTLFAEVYNELRRHGVPVIVEYDDPGNPFYIPRIVEVDGRECHVRFSVERGLALSRRTSPFYVQLDYNPSSTAQLRGARRERRVHIDAKRLAAWLERLAQKEAKVR